MSTQPLFGTHGFTPTKSPQRFPLKIEMVGGGSGSGGGSAGPDSGGFPFLPLIVIAGALAGVIYVRSRKKGVSKTQYIQSKVEQFKDVYSSVSGGASAKNSVVMAVEEFKAAHPELSSEVSYTQSCILGDFVAIKSMDGRLLAEVPYLRNSSAPQSDRRNQKPSYKPKSIEVAADKPQSSPTKAVAISTPKQDSSSDTGLNRSNNLKPVLIGVPLSVVVFATVFGYFLPKGIEMISSQGGSNSSAQIYESSKSPVEQIPPIKPAPEQSNSSEETPSQSSDVARFRSGIMGFVYDPPSNIRSYPDGPVICSVKERIRISLGGREGSWWTTNYCGQTGYIHEGQIKVEQD